MRNVVPFPIKPRSGRRAISVVRGPDAPEKASALLPLRKVGKTLTNTVRVVDAIYLIAWAVKENGGSTDKKRLRETIRSSNGRFTGVIAPYKFNKRGEVQWPEYIMIVTKGKWQITDKIVDIDPEVTKKILGE
jgi:hypothetical protein